MRVGLIQLTTRQDKSENLNKIDAFLKQLAADRVQLACLPEAFNFLGPQAENRKNAEPEQGPTRVFLENAAKRYGMYILGGSYAVEAANDRCTNTSLLFAPDGSLCARYDKIHLFDYQGATVPALQESSYIHPGSQAVLADTPYGRCGFSICYDLRFPELYRGLALRGARIVFVPAAFLLHTGKDHWETLLRARAIENQLYIVAAAQFGTHFPGRISYGKSMIIDPWGDIIARAPDRECAVFADLDFAHQDRLRTEMPILQHIRQNIFA